MVDVSDLIGAPFVVGARGPASFDCYSLVAELYQRAHGQQLPDFNRPCGLPAGEIAAVMDSQRHSCAWQAVPAQAGAIVLLRVEGAASHVGFMLDAHTFCHAWRDVGGVCIARLADWRHRVVGFYRYAG